MNRLGEAVRQKKKITSKLAKKGKKCPFWVFLYVSDNYLLQIFTQN
jgi:hypothetical protein